jgi:hypothetical protein
MVHWNCYVSHTGVPVKKKYNSHNSTWSHAQYVVFHLCFEILRNSNYAVVMCVEYLLNDGSAKHRQCN